MPCLNAYTKYLWELLVLAIIRPQKLLAFGAALGQNVGAATEPLYTEMAKNAITSTADGLSSSK
jgi:hypothetical protein